MSEEGRLKQNRKKCHEARDLFLSCTDAAQDAGKSEEEATKLCRTQLKVFKSSCPSTWVDHFIRKHNFERYKQQLAAQGVNIADDKSL